MNSETHSTSHSTLKASDPMGGSAFGGNEQSFKLDLIKEFSKEISVQTGSRISFGAIAGREGKFEFEGKEFAFGVKI